MQIIHPDLIERANHQYFATVRQKSPTTGFLAILVAQVLCDQVHVYGFASGRCNSTCYHYYECPYEERHFLDSTNSSAGYHDMQAQLQALRSLEQGRHIERHYASCPEVEANQQQSQTARLASKLLRRRSAPFVGVERSTI